VTTKFLFENILLLAVAFASGAMILWPYARRGVGGPFASPAEATLLINRQDALLLDVRDAAAFGAGHVINAKNIPLAQLEARAGDLAKFKDKPVICHCENGSQAGAALAVLKKQGFNNLFNLRGGYAAWKQAGLPTEK
jgi:rhodanese-related sulfurtransferase